MNFIVWLAIIILFAIVFLILLFACALTIFRKLNPSFRLLDQMPSPKGLPLLGNVLDLLDADTLFGTMRRWAKEYHTPYVIWLSNVFPTVILWTPEDMQSVLSNVRHNEKSAMYIFFDEWLEEGLLTSNGDKWQYRRKLITPTFHYNILKRFIDIFNKHSKSLASKFGNDNDEEVAIIAHIHEASLHTIAEAAMGAKLTDKESESKYFNAIQRKGELAVHRLMRPWLIPKFLYNFTKHAREDRVILKYLKYLTSNVIKQREVQFHANNLAASYDESNSVESLLLTKKKERFAMLDLLLNAKCKDEIDDKGIREEVDTFMFEGHDTLSMALTFLFMLVANHPDVQQKLYEEIETALEGSDKSPNYNDLHKMTYMDMVIKESLRLYPSVPVISRLTGEDFITSSGHKVPKGTVVVLNIFDTHRLESVYPNPNQFDPERFSIENSKTRHPYAYLAFSAGSRNCIGQKYAMLNMKCKITAVLKKFILLPVDTPETVKLRSDIVLRPATEIKIKFIPR